MAGCAPRGVFRRLPHRRMQAEQDALAGRLPSGMALTAAATWFSTQAKLYAVRPSRASMPSATAAAAKAVGNVMAARAANASRMAGAPHPICAIRRASDQPICAVSSRSSRVSRVARNQPSRSATASRRPACQSAYCSSHNGASQAASTASPSAIHRAADASSCTWRASTAASSPCE